MPIASKQSYYSSLGISGRQARQILTKTALGICFFINLVDSGESNLLFNRAISLNRAKNRAKFPIYNITQVINPDKKDEKQAMALGYASQHGKIDEVNKLIKDGANVNVSNNNVSTSLHIAAERGHLEIVKALIEAGANVNASNNNGSTSLHI